MHLARLAQVSLDESRARAELLAERHLPSRARGRRATAPIRTQALRERSRPAVDPRVEPLLEERHVCRDRRRARHGRRARRSGARRAAAAGAAATSTRCSSRSALSQLLRDLHRTGTQPRVPAAAAARRHRVRLDPHRRLDAAHPAATSTRRCGRPSSTGARRAGRRGLRRDAARAAAAAADSRHPQRPDAARPRRVRRPARPEPGRRVRRARHVLQHGQRAAVGRSIADGRSGGQPRVGRRAPRGRRRHRQPEAASCCSPIPAMRALLPEAAPGDVARAIWSAPDHPLRGLSEQTLVEPAVARAGVGDVSPIARRIARAADHDAPGQRRRRASSSASCSIARNLEYLSQVQSTLRYSRKLAALGRLSAGVAHEVKNPLNAMMIHLELLRQQFVAARRRSASRAGGARSGGRGRRAAALDRHGRRARARRRHRRRDPPARRGRAGVPEVHAARRISSCSRCAWRRCFDEVVPIVRPEAERAGVELDRRRATARPTSTAIRRCCGRRS